MVRTEQFTLRNEKPMYERTTGGKENEKYPINNLYYTPLYGHRSINLKFTLFDLDKDLYRPITFHAIELFTLFYTLMKTLCF